MFVIKHLDEQNFVDVSYLLGARLTFAHSIEERDGQTRIDIRVDMAGPLAFVWKIIIGKGIAKAVQPDTDRLVALVEQASNRIQ